MSEKSPREIIAEEVADFCYHAGLSMSRKVQAAAFVIERAVLPRNERHYNAETMKQHIIKFLDEKMADVKIIKG